MHIQVSVVCTNFQIGMHKFNKHTVAQKPHHPVYSNRSDQTTGMHTMHCDGMPQVYNHQNGPGHSFQSWFSLRSLLFTVASYYVQ